MAKKKLMRVTTPRGVAGYSHVDKPDEGGRYSDGKYKVDIIIDKDDPFVAKLDRMTEEVAATMFPKASAKALANVKRPWQDGDAKTNSETGEPLEAYAGKIIIRAKTTFKPTVIDGKRQPVDTDKVKVYSGDIIKVCIDLNPYGDTLAKAGVNPYLVGIQLIEKRGGSGGDVSGEFEDEEDADDLSDYGSNASSDDSSDTSDDDTSTAKDDDVDF